ncbi:MULTISPECIES: peptidase domain-containing ABC transporter [unclassified Methylobacterium]|uniref:peptidase domain-containing ABC transporter n=1 Tax=unclassified Methylobacterium TaxID=2615210 RepID=UPI000AFB221C|nr:MULTISPECIES: peptidase domain-containing ABC transporter [unclassified Methylobacterium]
MSFLNRRRAVKPILQSEANECGLACLAMIANYHRHDVDLTYMRTLFPLSRSGMTLANIVEVAGALSLDAQGYGLANVGELANLSLPALLHWQGNHFVVLERIVGDTFHVMDPQFGLRLYQRADMERYFSGVALEFEPRIDFSKVESKSATSFFELFRSIRGLGNVLSQVTIVSLAIGLLSLSTPILLEIALDTVIPQTDLDLLAVLTIGLGFFLVFEAIAKGLRDYITLRSSILLQIAFTRNVVGHAMRLPLKFFESRHPGDFVVRLDSIEHVKASLVGGLVASVADALMSILIVGLMFYYSPAMTMVSLLTLVAVLALRFVSFPALRRYTDASLDAHSQERSLLIDGLRRIQTLKAHNTSELFTMRWFESFVRFANTDFQARKAAIATELFIHIAIVLSTVLTLYMGVTGVMKSTLSVGMLYAFFALRNHFFEIVNLLATNLLQFSIMKVHFKRLDDVIGQEAEPHADAAAVDRRIRRTVSLENVMVRFGRADRPLLENVNLSIDLERKESIAILGLSGSGKSSLLKIIASLHEPAEGRLLIDGQPISQFGKREFRANLGAVFADDGVFAGTVADNLAMFDPDVTKAAMVKALDCVGLAEEIERLPQGFATLVSEESSILSTGQRRRLLLARALCRSPRLLLLDEVTANLDPATELALVEGLKRVPAAKIFVTHSEMLLDQVDRAFRVQDGRLVEVHRTPVALSA